MGRARFEPYGYMADVGSCAWAYVGGRGEGQHS